MTRSEELLAKISVVKLTVISGININLQRLAKISVLLFYFLAFIPPAHASIMLKVIAVNPSKEASQKVPVKVYLPKETRVEDVVDKADLDIAYDTQQGSYYVYGEYELKPGETVIKDIEIRDIWVVPDSQLEALRADITKTANLVKGTEFGDRVAFLKEGILAKLDQIAENQRSAPANPEQHISNYRDNLAIMDEAKKDLALARSFLSQVKAIPSAVIWRLILAIVIFLGLLGGAFYIIWQKQLKTITQDDTFFVPGEDEPDEERPKDERTKELKNEGTEERKNERTEERKDGGT